MSWLNRFFKSEAVDPRIPTAASVSFDTKGYRVMNRTQERIEWSDLAGDQVVATLEASIDMSGPVEAIRARCRQDALDAGGGIISVDVVSCPDTPAISVVRKFEDRPGHMYEGQLLIPLRDASVGITLRATERGTTGIREAVVTKHLFDRGRLSVPDGVAGSGVRKVQGWQIDPYDASHDVTALCALADDERLDELFPHHPLSKVREWLRRIAGTVRIDDAVRADPAAVAASSAAHESRLSAALSSSIVGLLYFEIGVPATAEKLFQDAASRGEGKDGGAARAEALTFLAFAREVQGKLDHAEQAMAESHRAFQAAAGSEDLCTIRARANLARLYVTQGKLEQAAPILEEVIPALEARGNDIDVAVALNALGLVRLGWHGYQEAAGLFERSLRRFENAEQGMRQPIRDRADVLNNLAVAFDAMGDRPAASQAKAAARNLAAAAGPHA